VLVDDEVVGRLPGPGLCIFLGVTHDDNEETARRMAVKIHELRILRDERSAADDDAPLLVISQFTVYGDARCCAAGTPPASNAMSSGVVLLMRARAIGPSS
jgi:D-tyrosyl-tRNA(Tyr) deacylase